MQAGTLNRMIELQKPAQAQDDAGQPSQTWVPVAKVWANIRYLNGIETVKSNAPISVARASIRIRRRTDVQASWRAVLGTTIFDIRSVLPNEQDWTSVDLACETGASNG